MKPSQTPRHAPNWDAVPAETDRPFPTTLGDDGGILCLGLFRTGTYSMAKALNILGYSRVLHGLDMRAGLAGLDALTQEPWSRAAWANLPFLHRVLYPDPDSPPPWLGQQFVSETQPFSREAWDEICNLGSYHAVTDTASLYAEQLIDAYPNAKVILCYRDPDTWAASVEKTFVGVVTSRGGRLVRRWAEPLLGGSYPITQLWDVLRGWFEVETAEEMRAVYAKRYEEHYEMVRSLVPHERLLEYRLGDGWGPLCEFLGTPVPWVEYPRVNEGKRLRILLKAGIVITLVRAVVAVLKYPLLAVGVWMIIRAAGWDRAWQ
ncbi:hypothetical protein QBC34DRAFT_432701 [Podospora aff. communis PSN243]|uniref:NAD dependent epimerase/dehydratase n=1 Tax=Podospora aff. communis PSN243 TaxID=3040156 RepID=A0AAV9H3P4_9PEZI|nr:hypothetical protein QBC34DRAFT_432701 [Podospora aff. communis PSN243]